MRFANPRLISFILFAALPGCMPMPGMTPAMGIPGLSGSTPNPAGALFSASTDCASMGLVLADPAQPDILKDQVRVAMVAGGCAV